MRNCASEVPANLPGETPGFWLGLSCRLNASYNCPMVLFTQTSFSATGVQSLCWRGDDLVDWVGGGRVFATDGTERPARVRYGYRFDAATTSPDGRFAVIYERMGTKGLLLDDGRIVRELNRSFDFANAHEFPVVLFNDQGRPRPARALPRTCLPSRTGGGGKRATPDRICGSHPLGRLPFAVGGEPPWQAAAQRWLDVASARRCGVFRCRASACRPPSPSTTAKPFITRPIRAWRSKIRPVGGTMTASQWRTQPSPNRMASRTTPNPVLAGKVWRFTM